jgi:hypothetical protein
MIRGALTVGAAALFTLAVFPAVSQAQDLENVEEQSSDEPSLEELAIALADPNTTLGTLNFNIDYVSYKGDLPGAGSTESWRIGFQPVLPYALSETTNLYVRPNIPIVIDQPIPIVSGADVSPTGGGQFSTQDSDFSNSGTELGDISFDIAIGKTFPSKTVLAGGIVGTLDTATDDSVGLGQTLLGPEIAVAQVFDWGVVGVLVTHQWDVAGDDDFNTSITGGQYFYTINLRDGWQIQGQPAYSYNHEARGGEERWTLPVGTGIAKTMRLGKTPWKFSMQYWYFVKQADSLGPDFQLRFSFGPVVPLPW